MCLCGCEAVYQNKGYCYINLAPMFRIYKYQYTDSITKMCYLIIDAEIKVRYMSILIRSTNVYNIILQISRRK